MHFTTLPPFVIWERSVDAWGNSPRLVARETRGFLGLGLFSVTWVFLVTWVWLAMAKVLKTQQNNLILWDSKPVTYRITHCDETAGLKAFEHS